MLLSRGAQRLNGAHAQLYATYLGKGEQEQARLARLQAVLDQIISGLPADPGPLVRSLGAGSRATVPLPVLTTVLAGLKSDDSHDDLQYRSLPVIPVRTGNDQVVFRIDEQAVIAMVSELLASSVPAGATKTGNRVLVLNGVGTPGLGAKVREKLIPAGFVYVGSRNAPSLNYPKTQVLVKEATTGGRGAGRPGGEGSRRTDVECELERSDRDRRGCRRDRRAGLQVQVASAGVTASDRAVELGLAAAQAAADKLASDILLLDVSEQLVITDVFLLASAPNDRQVKAIVDDIEEQLRELGCKPLRREGEKEGRWVLLDFGDIVVHVQHQEERVFYALERLWKDCPVIPFVDRDVARATGRTS